MKNKAGFLIRSGFGIAALLACSQSAFAYQSAYGLKIPLRGGSKEIEEPAEVEIKEDAVLGGDVVSASTPADAANAANSHIRKLGSGSVLFEAKDGGLGLMASGKAPYAEDGANPDTVRLSRRKAYTMAFFRAKANLAEQLEGADVESMERITGSSIQRTSDDENRTLTDEQVSETITNHVKAMLQGIEIFEVKDEGGLVEVTVYCTPESASACATKGTRGIVAADLTSALDRIMDEVVQGFVPPLGARTIHCEETGQFAFVAYGSALARNARSARGQQTNLMNAEKGAKLRADKALVARLTGQELDYKTTLDDQSMEVFEEWEKFASEESPEGEAAEEEEALYGVESAFVNVFKTTEEGQSTVKGRKPAGVQPSMYMNDKTGWVTAVLVWIPASEALLDDIRKAPGGRGGGNALPKYGPAERGPTGRVGGHPGKKKDRLP